MEVKGVTPPEEQRSTHSPFDVNLVRLTNAIQLYNGFDTVIDAGAAEGHWSRMVAKIIPNVRVIAIEPIPELAKKLTLDFEVVECAIFSECKDVTFNVMTDSSESSLLYKSEGSQDLIVQGRTLECICNELEVSTGGIFLKTDLQGFDFEALLSLGSYLSQVRLIQMECQLAAYCEGMEDLTTRINRMSELGFHVIDVFNPIDRPSDSLLGQVDALFVRKEDLLGMENKWW